jgi:propanediol dehydratase small subunit
MIKQLVVSQLGDKSPAKPASSGGRISYADYPLGVKKPELIKTPTGKSMKEVTLEGVISGDVTTDDVRITPETLEMQAQVAESRGRTAFANNLRRAAELIPIPDARLLEMYNALRPYYSTKEELLAMASELETKYNAKISAALVYDAAEVYEARGRLKK